MNVIIIFLGSVGLPPFMDRTGKQSEIHLKYIFFNFKQNLSHMCNDTIVLQTCRRTHTHNHRGGMFSLCVLHAAGPRPLRHS